jgi:preprotein translocase subunit SecY
MVAVVAFIVLVERGERRIPVQYAKRVVGRRMMGGQSTHLAAEGECGRRDPDYLSLRLCWLAANRVAVPMVKNSPWLSGMLGALGRRAALLPRLRLLIVFFCFFYVSIIFNPNEAADNMRKYGGFIPGIRPARTRPSTWTRSCPRSPWWAACICRSCR